VIEGIESKIHRFCIGVQWHPEFLITGQDETLFAGLIAATRA
jgi:putative glutamine amidotransferase